jgi:hypothetical protein
MPHGTNPSTEALRTTDDPRSMVIDRIVLASIFAYALTTLTLVSRSWYLADDFVLIWKAQQPDLLHTMFTPYVAHVLPGDFLLTRLTQIPAAMNWWINASVITAGLTLAALLVWRVLRSLLGVRLLTVTLFILYLTSGSIILTAYWWAAAVEYVPTLIAVPSMILLLQRAIRRRTVLAAVLPSLALLGGAMFFEKILVYVPFLIALVATTPLVADAPPTSLGRLEQARRPLAILLVVACGYGVLYLVLASGARSGAHLSTHAFGHLVPTAIIGGFLRNLIGLQRSRGEFGFEPVQLLSILVVMALVVRTVLRDRAGLRYWAIIAFLVLTNIALLAVASRRYPGSYRYWCDLVFPTLLLMGLSQVGSRFEFRARSMGSEDPDRRWSIPRPLVIIGILLLMVTATVNMATLRPRIQTGIGHSYVDTARAASAAADSPIVLLPEQAPPDVLNILLAPYNITRTILEPSGSPVRFESWTTDPHTVLPNGDIVPARLADRHRTIGVTGGCGRSLQGAAEQSYLLDRDLISEAIPVGELTYRADAPTTLTVSWIGGSTEIPIEPGRRTVTFSMSAGTTRAFVVSQSAGSTCIVGLAAGELEPE